MTAWRCDSTVSPPVRHAVTQLLAAVLLSACVASKPAAESPRASATGPAVVSSSEATSGPQDSEAGATGTDASASGPAAPGTPGASSGATDSAPATSPNGHEAPSMGTETPPLEDPLAQGIPTPGDLKRLDFRGGEPRVPVRLMEGRNEVTFSPRGRMRLRFGGPDEKMLDAAAGTRWTVRVTQGSPAVLSARVQLAEFRMADRAGLQAALESWREKGLAVRAQVLGSVYGIAGKVIDNRRTLLLVDEVLTPEAAGLKQAELLRSHGVQTTLFEEVRTPSKAILEVRDEAGVVVGMAQDRLDAETPDGAGFDVRQVEYGVGYDFHGFEDRTFRGALQLVVDRSGQLAVVNVVPLEDLLKGLVPAEIFARAHSEALKAQAVTARGEVLAKVGIKHLADPYLLCSEQHCAVYRGRTGEAASTTAAVEATRGEGLFSEDGRLVDSVYSAVCGGHTEDNDVVWGGPPDPSLRGRPDVIGPVGAHPLPASLERWLTTANLPAACRLSSFAQPSKFRWEKRFTAEQVDTRLKRLGVGRVQALALTDRGVSGRAAVLTVSGDKGATQVRGELNIRRLFGMLNSSMAVVEAERDAGGRLTGWLFRGGGWGHGVGMCQTGAIGRAEAGQRYQDILRHYFNGATVAPIY
ncbi:MULTISPECIES: SpoIID/LytB domain-containing protein [unclassified Myxococcus]|uniref:SpoIID/LytB domain-containing protein n=1 Tax=Myxococcus TaxID=32 RepID=UPI00114434F1|nr:MULTISPECIES: SpoIID/LytB domain-containing protein [unclassified Myxococcus]NOK04368.1 SpoIID/LytB domain-containing protein [Myxococcus xanthus]